MPPNGRASRAHLRGSVNSSTLNPSICARKRPPAEAAVAEAEREVEGEELLAGDDRLGGVKARAVRVGDRHGEGGEVRPLLEELELRVHGLVLEFSVGVVVVETLHADDFGDPAVHLEPVEQADGAEVVPVRADLRGAEAVPVLLHDACGGGFEEAGHAEVVRAGERLVPGGAGARPGRGARPPRRDPERVAVRKRQVRGTSLQQPRMGEGSGNGFAGFPRQGGRREVRVVGISAGGDDQGGERRVVRERVGCRGAGPLPPR